MISPDLLTPTSPFPVGRIFSRSFGGKSHRKGLFTRFGEAGVSGYQADRDSLAEGTFVIHTTGKGNDSIGLLTFSLASAILLFNFTKHPPLLTSPPIDFNSVNVFFLLPRLLYSEEQ